jgi:excisionase family DNA binding protein
MAKLLTTKEAAEALGISPARVRQMILSGRLPAEKIGRDQLIQEKDLALVANRRTGRPTKAEADLTRSGKSKRKARATKK